MQSRADAVKVAAKVSLAKIDGSGNDRGWCFYICRNTQQLLFPDGGVATLIPSFKPSHAC